MMTLTENNDMKKVEDNDNCPQVLHEVVITSRCDIKHLAQVRA